LLVVFDATARYLFSEGSTALQELEWHFFDVVILLSIAYTLRNNSHVRVDIFYENFSLKTKSIINLIAGIFFILPLSFLIVYIGVGFVELSFVQNEASSDPGGLKYRWIVKSLMPLAFVLLALQAFSELYKDIKELRQTQRDTIRHSQRDTIRQTQRDTIRHSQLDWESSADSQVKPENDEACQTENDEVCQHEIDGNLELKI
jgi:TRAP-type mannitol/chloroaromatic compound transport system permease small subunit